jgi:hypothetical protein
MWWIYSVPTLQIQKQFEVIAAQFGEARYCSYIHGVGLRG